MASLLTMVIVCVYGYLLFIFNIDYYYGYQLLIFSIDYY